MRTRPTIRIRILFVLLLLSPLVVFGIALGVIDSANRSSVSDLSRRLSHEVSARINDHIENFLNEAQRINAMNARLIADGFLDDESQPEMERYFRNQIALHPGLSSIYFGNTTGGLVGSGIEGGLPYVTGTAEYRTGTFYKYRAEPDGSRGALLASVTPFDAVSRGWYQAALRKDSAVWSAAYVLITGQDMAVAASRPVYDARGELRGVLAVDLFLSQFSAFLRTIDISARGVAFIVDRDGFLIATSTDDPLYQAATTDAPARRTSASAADNPLIQTAMERVEAKNRPVGTILTDRIRIAGEWCTVEVSMIHAMGSPAWFAYVVVPENDFLAQSTRTLRAALSVSLAMVAALFVLVLFISWYVTLPVLKLVENLQSFSGSHLQEIEGASPIDEIQVLITSFNAMSKELIREIREREETATKLQGAVAEREVLIRELNHRTKNNMNVISAMLRLQSTFIHDETTIRTLHELEGRIQSMALVHQKLYRSPNLSRIDLRDYLDDLLNLLKRTNNLNERTTALVLRADQVDASIDIAVPCGLVVNELVTNAMKHAFSGSKKGTITVELRVVRDGSITLHVWDDGDGFPEGFELRSQDTLGLQTIHMIVEHQLQGEVAFRSEGGVHCTCVFPNTVPDV